MIERDSIKIYNSRQEKKIKQLQFLSKNIEKQYPVIYQAVSYGEDLSNDLNALLHQNMKEIQFQYITKLSVMPILENIRNLPQTLISAKFYVFPYQMTIETADLLFKNFIYLPKSIQKLNISMNFYDNEDNISRFLIINLPKINPRLQKLKINLSGFSNLLEFSKKFDTLPVHLKQFKLKVNKVELTAAQFATFATNLSRLPKGLTKFNLSFDEIYSLEPLYQNFSNMSSSINNICFRFKKASYSNEEMIKFNKSLVKSFPNLKKLRLFLPNNLISQDSFDIICRNLPENLTKLHCMVSGQSTNDSLKVFPLNKLQSVFLNLSENYNSDDDIIKFFEDFFVNQNILHLHLILNDEETSFSCIQFLIDNLEKLPKQLISFKLVLKKPSFPIEKIQIPDQTLSKIPSNVKKFSIKMDFDLSALVIKNFISIYRQIGQLHLGIEKFCFKLNCSQLIFSIKYSQITLGCFLKSIFKDKRQCKKFNENFIQLLMDTPPNFKLESVNLPPDTYFF